MTVSTYQLLAIARDARLDGRGAEYAAILDEIDSHVAWVRRAPSSPWNLQDYSALLKEMYPPHLVAEMSYRRHPLLRAPDGIEVRYRFYTNLVCAAPGFSGIVTDV